MVSGTLILTLLFVNVVNAFTLWGRFTGVSSNGQCTVDHNGVVNANTGVITPISTNYVYVGSSATIDGISALDNKNGVFYYTTDGSTKDIYSVQLVTGALNPPIDVYANVIAGLTFDNAGGRLIIAYLDQNNNQVLMYYPVNGAQITATSVPKSVPLTNAAVYSSQSSTYYNAASNPSINTTIITAFTSSGFKSYTIPNCPVGYIIDMFLDSSNNLIGMGEYFKGNTLLYYYVSFDLNQLTCSPSLLKTTGIVTATTYSVPDDIMFFNEAINGGDLIRMYFPANDTLTRVNSQYVVEDLQVQV